MRRLKEYLKSHSSSSMIYVFLVVSLAILLYVIFNYGLYIGFTLSFLPVIVIIVYLLIRKPFLAFICLFVFNYFISGLSRYIMTISPGIAVDILIVIVSLIVILNLLSAKRSVVPINAINGLTFAALMWFLYCIFLFLNPTTFSFYGWFQSARGVSIYFLLISIISALILRNFKDVKILLVVWAILSLTAVLKAYIQKNYGFDFAEWRWLNQGGSRTHIINTGIRYFSFYPDAANFGTGIAFAGVVFGFVSLAYKNLWHRTFFIFTSIACAYGMMLSGTRGSLAVPFVGMFVYTILSRSFKTLVFSIVLTALSFGILKYTDLGSGNVFVRRMRTAFDPNDASLRVRLDNQAKLRDYMKDKPFGAGIGMARKRSDKYEPNYYLSTIPTDSWYVLIWVETGIVGLVIHILILLYIITYGTFILYFKLKHPQIKGVVMALISGISGVYIASYSIEIMGQFPTGFILYVSMTVIFLSPKFDKELCEIENGNHMLPSKNEA